ncbi:hypothetical protein, partial [Phenylobacterium sp.]|uniref:hypothetical protein n=1 Tax=Phenylobacterium sp. TaxID=1871053 RepID=UPI00286C114A
MPLTPVEWPLRLVPRRSPPLIRAATISLVALLAAIFSRGAFLGWDDAFGLSVTYFPAFVIATLYAGQAWGWGMVVIALLAGSLGRNTFPAGLSAPALIV